MTISLIGKLLIFISLLVIVNALENNDNKNDSNISDNDEIEILWGHKEIDDINVPLRFFLLGDWGKSSDYGSRKLDGNDDDKPNNDNLPVMGNNNNNNNNKNKYYQLEIAAAMDTYARGIKDGGEPSFVAALGDNFYKNGVASATDSLWNNLFVNVYTKPYATLAIPWYPVFGNHDYGGGNSYVQAQLDRTQQKIDNYWTFPATNYTKIYHLPKHGMIGMLFIDTTTLAPSENKCCNQNGGISLDVQEQRIKNQLYHIEKNLIKLSKKKVQWIITIGHYPIFSKGEHGDTDELVTYLEPLFLQYGVSAYFCGHDHITEHLSRNGIEYFVTGAGSMTDKLGQNVNSGAQLNYYLEYQSAFGVVEATSKTLTVEIYDTNPTKVYSYTMTNPRTKVELPEDTNPRTDDRTKFDDDNDVISPRKANPKALQTVLTVGISVSAIFSAVLLINFIRVRYRKRKSKLRRATKIILTSPDSPLLKYNDYDYEDIEMMNRFRSDLYNISEVTDDNDTDTESIFKTSTSLNSLQPDNVIMVSEALENRATNGVIYTKPKHIRAHTVAF